MLISDIATKARRILGDTDKQRWTDERLLDIVNAGLKDINKFAGVYRKEHFIPMQKYVRRYPLPLDMLKITSLEYNKVPLYIHNLANAPRIDIYASKDQINVGVLELNNIVDEYNTGGRFIQGIQPELATGPAQATDLWANNMWNNEGIWDGSQIFGASTTFIPTDSLYGVAVDPVIQTSGVSTDLVIPLDSVNYLLTTKYGLLSNVMTKGTELRVKTGGSPYGVMTSITGALSPSDSSGSIGTLVGKPHRIAGRYGTVVSVLKPREYVKVKYKALPAEVTALEVAMPLAPSWVEPLINYIVGVALQDDNDASNSARGEKFLSKYVRELELEQVESVTDYSAGSKKYRTEYTGGIV